MGRFWSLLFLSVPVLGVAIFVTAAADIWPYGHGGAALFPPGHWLPENINPGGDVIDDLWNFILILTGAIFIATGLVLFWFLWKYDAAENSEPAKFTHGSHVLEVVWSILPAATLLFIAVVQMNAWADNKMRRPTTVALDEHGQEMTDDHGDPVEVPKPPLALVTGRQFEWRIRYAGPSDIEYNGSHFDGVVGLGAGEDGELYTVDDTRDDLFTVNELHVPVDEEIVLQVESQDVLHSFFLPNLRVKQDVIPGMTQYVWFRATKVGSYDIVCAELCGWGHYKMRGRLVVQTREEFERWYKDKYAAQETSSYAEPEEE